MQTHAKRGMSFNMQLANTDKVRLEEVFRLGVLRDGIQLTVTDIKFPIFGQVIPRIEIVITGPDFLKKVTVRINQESGFMFNGETLEAWINDKHEQVACSQFIDPERAPTGMYNFGTLRENGIRSFVFDYHTYCAYSCDFCFKENEWEVLAIQGGGSTNYKANYDQCLNYVYSHAEDFRNKYDIVWLCTGSITSEKTELERHCKIAKALRQVGYKEGIYVSQVVPPGIKDDRQKRLDYLHLLKEAGISRFNSGVEIVNSEYRKQYIHGFKSTYTFDDYVNIFEDAVSVFGRQGVGSCLLAGIEPSRETLFGLDTIAALSVVPSPTVLTPFVMKQMAIPFVYDLDELINVHVRFYEIIRKYNLPVFSGVFSLA
ncbi:MAG TPA: radical SAM protein [Pyrinomonadaceae bacterium]|jgi:hypothetical protein